VQHAEKADDPTNKNPLLTKNGENRAISGKKKLKHNNIYSPIINELQPRQLLAKKKKKANQNL
jgi:hypothetical protein